MSEVVESPELRKMAADLAEEFRRVATDLDKHTKNVNIARVTGGAAGVAGGAIAIAGLIAIPFTAGLSAVVVGIGGAIAAGAGGATAGGAQIAKFVIEKITLKDVEKKWSTFRKDVMSSKNLKGTMDCKDALSSAMNQVGTGIQIQKGIVGIVKGGSAVAGAGVRTAGSTGARLLSVLASTTVVLNAVLIGLSVYDIVDGAIQIHKDKGSKAGNSLRELAVALDQFAKEGKIL